MEAWDGRSPEAWKERAQRETHRYGAGTARIGAQLLERNALPPPIVEAVNSTFDTPSATQTALGCTTAISRVGGLVLRRRAQGSDLATIRSVVGLLAEPLKRISLAEDQATNAFIEVAVTSQSWLESAN
jgi:hypothetical protein